MPEIFTDGIYKTKEPSRYSYKNSLKTMSLDINVNFITMKEI